MNSTPACSRADWSFHSVRTEPVISTEVSIRFTVEIATSASLESSRPLFCTIGPKTTSFGSVMDKLTLSIEVSRFLRLKEQLATDFPDTDEETLADTLEGITDLQEMIAALIRSALVDEALQAGLRSRLEEMRQRLARLEERGIKKRQLVLEAMCDAGLKKLEQPDFTVSARSGMSPLLIVADDLIPEPYSVPQPPKLDRQTLLADLKRRAGIPGAQLGNPKP